MPRGQSLFATEIDAAASTCAAVVGLGSEKRHGRGPRDECGRRSNACLDVIACGGVVAAGQRFRHFMSACATQRHSQATRVGDNSCTRSLAVQNGALAPGCRSDGSPVGGVVHHAGPASCAGPAFFLWVWSHGIGWVTPPRRWAAAHSISIGPFASTRLTQPRQSALRGVRALPLPGVRAPAPMRPSPGSRR